MPELGPNLARTGPEPGSCMATMTAPSMETGMKLRSWATPLVVGSFLLMGVTGVLMFFHLETTTMKLVHEWAGFVLVAGAVAHLALNWRAFTTYFKRPLARGIMALGVVVLGLTFVPGIIPGATEGAGLGPRVVMEAMGNARIEVLAELAGKTPETLLAQLQAAGIEGAAVGKTAKAVAGGNGEMLREILNTALVTQ